MVLVISSTLLEFFEEFRSNQAAEKLRDAARIMSEEEISVQLRYLDTLRDIATENSSTIVFPLPVDILKKLMAK